MPIISIPITRDGPVVIFTIGVSGPRQRALAAAHQPIPAAITARMLVDTGASGTCIVGTLLTPLGLIATSQVPMHSTSTGGVPVHCNLYDVSISMTFPGGIRINNPVFPIVECAALAGPIDGLLGRDFLAHCAFFYNGKDKTFCLSI